MSAIDEPDTETPLRRGWTTGACATAATRSALAAMLTGTFEDPVTITLPGGQTPAFALAYETLAETFAEAGIVKDAGDDPDVTHGATIIARVTRSAPGSGISFHAGQGVGMVTKPGLPIPPGQAAINPVPRKMMTEVVESLCAAHGIAPDIAITISVPDGAAIAEKTWNPRLGIVGGISILGTTGIVIPYSCSAWIHSIHRGIDVSRAMGLTHVVGSTGDASEKAAMARLNLPLEAYLDMGDFVGGLLKYLKAHPVPRLTLCGGFAKLTKLAQGAMDLHSARSQVDIGFLADLLDDAEMRATARNAGSANEILALSGGEAGALAHKVAVLARHSAQAMVGGAVFVDVLVTNRQGVIIGTSD